LSIVSASGFLHWPCFSAEMESRESLTEDLKPAGLDTLLPRAAAAAAALSWPGMGTLAADAGATAFDSLAAPKGPAPGAAAAAAAAAIGVAGLLLLSLSAVLRAWPSSTCAAREAKLREESVSDTD
jgi:hypothetical protein